MSDHHEIVLTGDRIDFGGKSTIRQKVDNQKVARPIVHFDNLSAFPYLADFLYLADEEVIREVDSE